jgi:hypothetical protein
MYLHCTYGTLMCDINIYYLSHNLCIAKDKIMATLCECNTSVRHIAARQKYLIFRDYVNSNICFLFRLTNLDESGRKTG